MPEGYQGASNVECRRPEAGPEGTQGRDVTRHLDAGAPGSRALHPWARAPNPRKLSHIQWRIHTFLSFVGPEGPASTDATKEKEKCRILDVGRFPIVGNRTKTLFLGVTQR